MDDARTGLVEVFKGLIHLGGGAASQILAEGGVVERSLEEAAATTLREQLAAMGLEATIEAVSVNDDVDWQFVLNPVSWSEQERHSRQSEPSRFDVSALSDLSRLLGHRDDGTSLLTGRVEYDGEDVAGLGVVVYVDEGDRRTVATTDVGAEGQFVITDIADQLGDVDGEAQPFGVAVTDGEQFLPVTHAPFWWRPDGAVGHEVVVFAKSPSLAASRSVVVGRVTDRADQPIEDYRVQAVDRGLEAERLLGASTTDPDGQFVVVYGTDADAPLVGRPDLVVRAAPRHEDAMADAVKSDPIEAANQLERVNLQATGVVVSEYDLLVERVSSILSVESLATLDGDRVNRLQREVSLDGPAFPQGDESLDILHAAMTLASDSRVEPAVLYKLGRMGVDLSPAGFAAADSADLEDALRADDGTDRPVVTIPEAVVDDVLADVRDLQAELVELEVRVVTVSGTVIEMGTDERRPPLPDLMVSLRPANGEGGEENGSERTVATGRTDSQGRFALRHVVDAEAPARYVLVVTAPIGRELERVSVEPDDEDVEVVIDSAVLSELTSTSITAMTDHLSEEIPSRLVEELHDAGIESLADVRARGGVGDGTAFREEDAPLLRRIEGHAQLEVLSPDVAVNEALLEHGYVDPLTVLTDGRDSFVGTVSDSLETDEAIRLYDTAATIRDFLDSLSVLDIPTVLPMPEPCDCEECNTIVSPRAYLANLLGFLTETVTTTERAVGETTVYRVRAGPVEADSATLTALLSLLDGFGDLGTYPVDEFKLTTSGQAVLDTYDEARARSVKGTILQTGSPASILEVTSSVALPQEWDSAVPVGVNDLEGVFHQPFAALVESCDTAEERVRTVRLCVEVLAASLGEEVLQFLRDDADAAAYRLSAYEALLEQLGTSSTELRRTLSRGSEDERTRLADRLGIPVDHLAALLLDTDAPLVADDGLSEDALERLFGLPAIALLSDDTTFEMPAETRLLTAGDTGTVPGFVPDESVELQRADGDDGWSLVRTVAADDEGAVTLVVQGLSGGDYRLVGERHEVGFTVADIESPRVLLPDPLRTAREDPTPQLVTWQTTYLHEAWARQDHPSDAFTAHERPRVDPDLLGPDDFRHPDPDTTVDAANDPAENAFGLWRRRRAFVDDRVTHYHAQTEGLDGFDLAALLADLGSEGFTYDGTAQPAPWEGVTPLVPLPQGGGPPMLADLEALVDRLRAGHEPAGEAVASFDDDALESRLATLGFDADGEALVRFLELYEADAAHRADDRNEPLSAEETAEAISIAVEVEKRSLAAAWIAEETTQDIHMGPAAFWGALRPPRRGRWSAVIDADYGSRPFIDPEAVAIADLPDQVAGRDARRVWRTRRTELDDKREALEAAYQTRGIETVATETFGADVPFEVEGVTEPSWADYVTARINDLERGDEAAQNRLETEAATLELTDPAFESFLIVGASTSDPDETLPGDDRLSALLNDLLTAWKRRERYPVETASGVEDGPWIDEEKTENLRTYWRTRKAALPSWRADSADRARWESAYHRAASPPILDPDVVDPAEIATPLPGEIAYDLWQERRTWLEGEHRRLISALETQGFEPTVATELGVPDDTLSTLTADRENGVDIEGRLDQLGLSIPAFEYLHAAASTSRPDGWTSEVAAILTVVHRRRRFGEWRQVERAADLVQDDRFFVLAASDPTSDDATAVDRWRRDPERREEWIDCLESRLDRLESIEPDLAESVGAVEEETLEAYRSLLVESAETPPDEDPVEWLSERLLVDMAVDGCQETTRIAQAMTSLQDLVFGLRSPAVEGTAPHGFSLEPTDTFEEQWRWLGSYATWKAAMLVFVYPQNLLLPTLRPDELTTPAFDRLAADHRPRDRMTPADARTIAADYEDYLRDVFSMRVEATCRTPSFQRGGGAAVGRNVFLQFGVGGETGGLYWSVFDPDRAEAVPAYAHSFWIPLSLPSQQFEVIGAAPRMNPANDEVLVQLFLMVRKADSYDREMHVATLDVATMQWEMAEGALELEPIELDPVEGSHIVGDNVQAVIVQTDTITTSPTLAILQNEFVRFVRWDAASDGWVVTTYEPDWVGADASIRSRGMGLVATLLGAAHIGDYNERETRYVVCLAGSRVHDGLEGLYGIGYTVDWTERPEEATESAEEGTEDESDEKSVSDGPPLTPFGVYYDARAKLLADDDGFDDWHGLVVTNGLAYVMYSGAEQSRYRSISTRHMERVEGLGSYSYRALLVDIERISFLPPPTVARVQMAVPNNHQSTPDHLTFHIDPEGEKAGAVGTYLYRVWTIDGLQKDTGPNVRLVPENTSDGAPLPAVTTEFSNPSGRAHRLKTLNLVNQAEKRHLTYIEEAYHHLPLFLADRLHQSGYYESALSWFRTVYDYGTTDVQELSPVIQREHLADALGIGLPDDWLFDAVAPHAYAAYHAGAGRNPHTQYTLIATIRCLLDYADDEFTTDTAESLPRARRLYETAEDLLASDEFPAPTDPCGSLEIEVQEPRRVRSAATTATTTNSLTATLNGTQFRVDTGDVDPTMVAAGLGRVNEALVAINSREARETAAAALTDVLGDDGPIEERLEAAMTAVREAAESVATPPGTIASFDPAAVNHRERYDRLLSDAWVAARTRELAATVGRTGSEAGTVVKPDGGTIAMAGDGAGPWTLTDERPKPVVQLSRYAAEFCLPRNPVLESLALHVELNLHKLRTCRNIAGMERAMEPYAAPTDIESSMPSVGGRGQLSLPGTRHIQPTPYRFDTLLTQATELTTLARTVESDLLRALERRDEESYRLLEARQNLEQSEAHIRLRDLHVDQAENEVELYEFQRGLAEIRARTYEQWIMQGLNKYENEMINAYERAATFQILSTSARAATQSANAAVTAATADWSAAPAAWAAWGTFTALAAAEASLTSLGIDAQKDAQVASVHANFERQKDQWELQLQLADREQRIGGQQVTLAEDGLRIAGQELAIAELRAEHAASTLEFLDTKETNVELYDWMVGILEEVTHYLLQQATAMARLAEAQLAFERQEPPTDIVQRDYWTPPIDMTAASLTGTEESDEPDRRGLTGPVRLLRDLTALEQHAFETNDRKLHVTKTISLADLTPLAFQRFIETGVLEFTTGAELFERDNPDLYLRLVRRVEASVIALTPATGINATLSASGISRTVVPGQPYRTQVIQRPPETVVLNAPMSDDGVFELRPEAERGMRLPFEGMGVDTSWQFRLPKASNQFDFDSILDVLLHIEYTALENRDYGATVRDRFGSSVTADAAFSLRTGFPDQWYDLHNPETTADPMAVSFAIDRRDFPPNLTDIGLEDMMLYAVGSEAGRTALDEVEVTLGLTPPEGPGELTGVATPVDGVINSRRPNAVDWSLLASSAGTPVGEWTLRFPDAAEVRRLFTDDEITDLLFVVSYNATLPPDDE